MMRISKVAEAATGEYQVVGTLISIRESEWNRVNFRSPQLQVEDCSGRACVLVPRDLQGRLHELAVGQVVRLVANFKTHDWGLGGLARSWDVLPDGDVPNVVAAQPVSRCPVAARDSLAALADAIEEMANPAIRDAVNQVLANAMPELLHAGASWSHHHSESGGLLQHTVEVALLARDEARECFPDEPWRVEAVFLLAIIHDLAKAQVQRADRGNAFIRSARHELGSMALASPVLMELAEAHPPAGAVAGTVLRWLLQEKVYRRDFPCPEGEIIRQADMTSARRYNCLKKAADRAANDDHFDIAVNLS